MEQQPGALEEGRGQPPGGAGGGGRVLELLRNPALALHPTSLLSLREARMLGIPERLEDAPGGGPPMGKCRAITYLSTTVLLTLTGVSLGCAAIISLVVEV
mmetsp:Transcript_84491/g.220679  ORF Transcript_84491/g.220679 Transcript_84491/m.220679 type:complete len:101 (+) Transcript_84491:92-394(+)